MFCLITVYDFSGGGLVPPIQYRQVARVLLGRAITDSLQVKSLLLRSPDMLEKKKLQRGHKETCDAARSCCCFLHRPSTMVGIDRKHGYDVATQGPV